MNKEIIKTKERIIEIEKIRNIYQCRIISNGNIYEGEHWKKYEAYKNADDQTNGKFDYTKIYI